MVVVENGQEGVENGQEVVGSEQVVVGNGQEEEESGQAVVEVSLGSWGLPGGDHPLVVVVRIWVLEAWVMEG